MNLALADTESYEKLNHPNSPAYIYLNDERLNKNVWVISEALPHLTQKAHRLNLKKLYFEGISLKWLNELTKLTVLIATGSRHWGLSRVISVMQSIKRFNQWLIEKEYLTESCLSQQVIQQWIKVANISWVNGLSSWTKILYEIQYISFKVKRDNKFQVSQPRSPQIIPEKIKYELDYHLKNLDSTIYLAVKILESLGLRSKELPNIPLNCLSKQEEVYQIRIATGKQDDKIKKRDIPEELVLLVQQQQQKVKTEFGENFPWLIPNWKRSWGYSFHHRIVYEFLPEQLKGCSEKLNLIIKNIIKENNIRSESGQLAHVTTHYFRRTYATVADRMGKSPDQIQHGLRHLNLDMQDSYVNVPPQEQEKRIKRTLVNKEGEITTYKTDKDAETLRVEWKLRQVETGICTRPNIMDECEYEYVCLGCEYVRFSEEHLPKLLAFRQSNLELLNRCIEQGQSDSRRANSVRQLLNILAKIIVPLENSLKPEKL